MAAISWPAVPFKLLMNGYSESQQDPILASNTDNGRILRRLKYTAAETYFQGNIIMTLAQYNTLETFYKTTAVYGLIPFNWTHPRLGTTVDAIFLSKPIATPVSGTNYSVAVSIAVLP